MRTTAYFRNYVFALSLLLFLLNTGCKYSNEQETKVDEIVQDSTIMKEVSTEISNETQLESPVENPAETKNENVEPPISPSFNDLEAEYADMLAPIISLKASHPETYWFIVSWLKTAYKTPNWKGYYSEEWKATAKRNGIDCSGFTRVMLDQIFDKKVSGGSQGILDSYCTPVGMESLEMGDLVFFRAPYAENDRIVHVGVYLQDNYFVHATSTKSAAAGLGLSINSLEEENWAKEFVTGGKVND